MKFMLFAVGALAATKVKRQLSVVESAIASISSGATTLDNGIKSFNPQSTASVTALTQTADDLIATVTRANTAVGDIDVLGTEAAGLAPAIQSLAAIVQTTVNDLKAAKSNFVAAGVGGVVYTKAQALQSAAATFTATTISKVPKSLQGLGTQLAAPIAAALDDAVNSFADQAGSGSSPTSGGSAPTTTAGATVGPADVTSTAPAPATTTTAAGGTTGPAVVATTTGAVPTPSYTGAAVVNAAGFGAVAMAVLAGAAML